jgi:HAD superfamily hydrolase (TIGR01549 family)
MIRALLFDVGGPLDTEVRHEAAINADIRAGLAREGFDVDDAAYAAAEQYAVETFAPNVYGAIIWNLTRGDASASARVWQWTASQSGQRDVFDLREGIADVLESIRARGLKLGLAANQPSRVIEQLSQRGVGHYFESWGISGVHGYRKPDVRLFLCVCEELAVDPNECIMVGDRIDNDIVPAGLLGMRTIRLVTGRHRDQKPRSWDELPDHEVEDAAGILSAIEAILAKDGA